MNRLKKKRGKFYNKRKLEDTWVNITKASRGIVSARMLKLKARQNYVTLRKKGTSYSFCHRGVKSHILVFWGYDTV
jgi:hypothetical protein